jgi:hypothetical protein
MIKLLVLDRNEKLNIDKSTESFSEIAHKIGEEYRELIAEMPGYEYDLNNIAEEALDLVQVLIGLLDKLPNLEEEIKIHNAKLKGRGWKFKKIYEIRQI